MMNNNLSDLKLPFIIWKTRKPELFKSLSLILIFVSAFFPVYDIIITGGLKISIFVFGINSNAITSLEQKTVNSFIFENLPIYLVENLFISYIVLFIIFSVIAIISIYSGFKTISLVASLFILAQFLMILLNIFFLQSNSGGVLGIAYYLLLIGFLLHFISMFLPHDN